MPLDDNLLTLTDYEIFGLSSLTISLDNTPLPAHTIIELKTSGRTYKNGRLPKVEEVRIAILRDINILLEEVDQESDDYRDIHEDNIHQLYYFADMRKVDNNQYFIRNTEFVNTILLNRDVIPKQNKYIDLYTCLDAYAKFSVLHNFRINVSINRDNISVTTFLDQTEYPNNNLVVYHSHYDERDYIIGNAPQFIRVIQRPTRD